MSRIWDVIVIGAGHAGVEAALAAARLGAGTLMVTIDLEGIAAMPCNPAIGGPAKGHLVREIDALGGEMGRAADATQLQVRVLNGSKGPAVQALRAQSDKTAYSAYMTKACRTQPGLTLKQALVEGVTRDADGTLRLVTADGEVLRTRAAVITTGTFLKGVCHTGDRRVVAGRADAPSAEGFSDSLRALGFELHRLKTGTPPRIAADSIDYAKMALEEGDVDAPTFSFENEGTGEPRPMTPCWQTRTTPETNAVILANLHRSPMYSGAIEGIGPRYCPSLEDKVVRFRDKESHPVFVEPETAEGDVMYIQGCSTSMPEDVQEAFIRTIPGLEGARFVRYGYAVEYDCLPATQLDRTLMTKRVPGLFAAGQMNGTSGYEEAAAQGLVAGINAARFAQGLPPVVLERPEGYVGTLIDDLVTKDIRDPYRMLTSRSEHRLTLRQDNADQRLTPIGRRIGLVGDARWARFEAKVAAIAAETAWLRKTRLSPNAEEARRFTALTGEPVDRSHTLEELLRRPPVTVAQLLEAVGRPADAMPRAVAEQLAIETKYEGYIKRQALAIERQRTLEDAPIPADFDYAAIGALSREAQDKLMRIRPLSLGQASRVGGVTPADVSLLTVHLAKAGMKQG